MRLNIVCRVVQCALVVWLSMALGVQWNHGLADNGDFSRIMTWFVSKPSGFETNWPPAGTADWQRRFFTYYLPRWDFDFAQSNPHAPGRLPVYSSVLLLWLPGIAANYLLYSSATLHLALMSLLPRLLLVACLILLLAWIARRCDGDAERLLFSLTLGVPFVLFLSAPDYVAFLNSFYQEAGSFIFLLLTLGALVRLRAGPARPRDAAIALAFLGLLMTSKASDFSWAFVALPPILAPFLLRRSRAAFVAACLGGAVALAAVSLYVTSGANDPRNIAFHGLFNGVLTLSDAPGERLAELGLGEATECVGTPAFVGPGPACVARYGDRQLRLKSAQVLLREPLIALKIPRLVAGRMQITQPEGLGTRTADERGPELPTPALPWSALKARAFPRGYALFLALAACAALCLPGLRRGRLAGDLSFVGILAASGCLTAMLVAFLGDGRQELVKHLFLANVAFDLAAIAALNVGIAHAISFGRRAIRRADMVSRATIPPAAPTGGAPLPGRR